MYTYATRHVDSDLPLSTSYKSSYQEASKKLNTTVPALSLVTTSEARNAASSSDPLSSGASVLLEIHLRRNKSTAPSQKMTRKEGEYLETYAHPALHMASMDFSLPKESATPTPQKMTKKERDSLLGEALDLLSED
jgi:hypothetical protein